MKLVSIDIETTGLNPANCQILEFAAVCFDPQPDLKDENGLAIKGEPRRWTTFECLIDHERLVGEPYALSMHSEILSELAGKKPPLRNMPILPSLEHLVIKFAKFLEDNGFNKDNRAFIAGKNYSAFDDRFLSKISGWSYLPLHHRVLDVGSLCFVPADGQINDLKTCLHRLGIRKEIGHRALEDALDVATCVSRFFA